MKNKHIDLITLNLVSYTIVGLVALSALFPFLMLVSSSMQSESTILKFGYSLFPREFDFKAYGYIFQNPVKIFNGYMISVFITVSGTAISLFFSSMAAYVMYKKEVRYRNKLAFYLYFTTLFNSGLVPYYMLIVKGLHLKNTLSVLLLVNLFNVIFILILRNFITGSIPDSIPESGKVDGANDFVIFIWIVLPLLKPALASIGLFIALSYWNDWWTAMMFIEKESLYPLQFMLYKILSITTFGGDLINRSGINVQFPRETLKLALTVVATGPMIFAYPFVQKYFVKGITLGAVKG